MEDDWVFDPSSFELDSGESGTHIPNLYNVCGTEEPVSASEMFIGDNPEESTVTCDSFENIADIWTLDLSAGQVLKASVDTALDGAELRMILVDPEGCLIEDVWPEAPCNNANEDCPSLEYPVFNAGIYKIIVTSDWCSGNDELTYTIDATLE